MKDTKEISRSMLSKIDAIYISNDVFIVSNQSFDCDKLIIKSGDRHIQLRSEALGEGGRIIFDEVSPFDGTQYPFEVKPRERAFTFDKFCRLENGMIDGIRFAADGVFLFVFALAHNLVLTISKYDLFEEKEMDFADEEASLWVVKR